MKGLTVFTTLIVRLCLVALVSCMAGCQGGVALPPDSGGTFSTVYSRFDPTGEFERLGCKVDPDLEGGSISPSELYGWRPIQGSLELPTGVSGCDAVADAICRSLERALGAKCSDELHQQPERQSGRPLYGMLRYVKDGMRGHVYVWLFPDESETKINYAILIREEQLHCGSRPAVAMSF